VCRDEVGEPRETSWSSPAPSAAFGSLARDAACRLVLSSPPSCMFAKFRFLFPLECVCRLENHMHHVWRVILLFEIRSVLCSSGYSWFSVEAPLCVPWFMKYFQVLCVIESTTRIYCLKMYEWCSYMYYDQVTTWFCYSSFVHFSGVCMHLGVTEHNVKTWKLCRRSC
jgi:hypothetical protein